MIEAVIKKEHFEKDISIVQLLSVLAKPVWDGVKI